MQMNTISNRLMFLLMGLITAWSSVGCTDTDPLITPTGRRLTCLMTAYLDYAVAKGHGPLNELELIAHLKNMPSFVIDVKDRSESTFTQLLISPRDGRPFIIEYGRPASVDCDDSEPPIIREDIGNEGTRYVAFADGQIECIDVNTHGTAVVGSLKGL